MSIDKHESYGGTSAEFWTNKKDRITVVGDYLGRLPSLELLNPRPGMRVLDAGCGAGWVARRIARSGADTYACDIEKTMLESAQKSEAEEPLGIHYAEADITTHLPYEDNSFDGVITTGVLIHFSPERCFSFFQEAARVLKSGGRLVLSVTHNDLYTFGDSLPKERETWIRHEAAGSAHKSGSREYREYYRNVDGNVFESLAWAHPKDALLRELTRAGLEVVKDQSMYVTDDVLQKTNQKGTVGVPAFLQIVAQKR